MEMIVYIFLLKLTDVEQGGGTAFPYLKRLLMPKKGAAAFWYNLHADGVRDLRTLHGGCPIIVGSKWGMLLALIFEDILSGKLMFFSTPCQCSIVGSESMCRAIDDLANCGPTVVNAIEGLFMTLVYFNI